MTTELQNMLVFEYLPHDLEKQLGPEFASLKVEILEQIKKSKIFDQKSIDINKIIIQLERNIHLGSSTYACKITLSSPKNNLNYVHKEEGKDYLHNIRVSVKNLIQYILDQKERIEDAKKSPNVNKF